MSWLDHAGDMVEEGTLPPELEEELFEWLVTFSGLLQGRAPGDFASLEEALDWFGDLPEVELQAMAKLGRQNKDVQAFLDAGSKLLDEAMGEG